MKYLKEQRYITTICVWVPDAVALTAMCRYDDCYPCSDVDAAKIGRLIRGLRGSTTPTDHFVRLTRAAKTANSPTRDRWRSYGARVLDVRHPNDTPPTDVELDGLNNYQLSEEKRRT